MQKYYILIILVIFFISCSRNNSASRTEDPAGESARNTVISYTENFFKDKVKDARIFMDDDGLITIKNEVTGYKINQLKITTGLIDEDNNYDAIVPFYTLNGESVMGYFHMILLNSADTFNVVKTMNDVFNIHGVKDRKIIAEVSTVSPDSPGYGCSECKEVVSIMYINGDFVKVE